MSTQVSNHDEKIENYGDCPNQLEAAIEGLSEDNLDLAPDAENWTIRQIIHHVADGDDIWKQFIKQAIGNPGGEFHLAWYWQIPQIMWAKRWNYEKRAVEPSLAMFRANRGHMVQLLSHTPEAMDMILRIHWPDGEEHDVSVAWVVEMQTQHVERHIEDIRKIREAHEV